MYSIILMLLVVSAVADNSVPVNSGVSLSITPVTGSVFTETGRVVLLCDATVAARQIVTISKESQRISWNGDLLPGFSRFTLREISEMTPGVERTFLYINPVCKKDSGNYSCTVYEPVQGSSGFTVVRSASQEMSVVDYDSSDMCSLGGPIVALIGDELSFVCMGQTANPTLEWTHSGTVVASTLSRSPNTVSRELNVAVTEQLQGVMYQCTATFNDCTTTEKTCTVGPITVLSEPRVIVSSFPDPIVLGGVAEFVCTVLPNATSLTSIVGWHTSPTLEENRAYFSSTRPSRMHLQTVTENDQGRIIYCTAYFQDGTQAVGQAELVISATGSNTVVDPTAETPREVSTSGTPVTSTLKPPGLPFILFGSYSVTVAIIIGGSILVAVLLAITVFCCCRKCKRRQAKKPATKQPLRISPSTFGGTTPGHQVPGSGTDGMYMYATIFDPDEKWGTAPGSTPSRVPTIEATDGRGYQKPVSGASTPPIYSQLGSPEIIRANNSYMETNIDSPSSQTHFGISLPDSMAGNALYQSSGEYVDPETVNQQHVNIEIATIRAERDMASVRPTPSGPNTPGYLAIGEVPDEIRERNPKSTEPVTYMEISN